MKLTPITKVDRFVSIDMRTIVRVCRWHEALDGYYDPPAIQDESAVWGTCHVTEPDTVHELGELQDVLREIAHQPMVAAAAVASPRRFAEMVAAAHDLGAVFYVASRAIWAVADQIADAKRFCSIEVKDECLEFHTLRHLELFGKQREPPGVYRLSFSLVDYTIQRRVLIEEYPKVAPRQ